MSALKQTKLPHHFAIYVPAKLHNENSWRFGLLDAYTTSFATGSWFDGEKTHDDDLAIVSVYCDDEGLPGITGWVLDYAQCLLNQGELAVFAIIDGTATIMEAA